MDIGAGLGLAETELPDLVVNLINLLVGVSTLVTLIYLMLGGLRWVTSGKSDQLRERAKKIIVRSLLGQTIILVAWALFVFIAGAVTSANASLFLAKV